MTRDEAIAIAVEALRDLHARGPSAWHPRGAARAVLEALAAAGAFLPECSRCETNDSDHFCESMADKLDAAGIR